MKIVNPEPTIQSAPIDNLRLKGVRWNSKLKSEMWHVWHSMRRLWWNRSLTALALYKNLRSLPSRILWLCSIRPNWPLGYCRECLQIPSSEFRLSCSGHLACSRDKQLLLNAHSWAEHAEEHLILRAWYLGAECAQNNYDSEKSKFADSYRVW